MAGSGFTSFSSPETTMSREMIEDRLGRPERRPEFRAEIGDGKQRHAARGQFFDDLNDPGTGPGIVSLKRVA
jgi:hypothetical protein